MKSKKSRKPVKENPNQLSFDFLYKDMTINVHIPRTSVKHLETHFTTTKRLAIKLAQN